jgi:thiol-disulfide isomerase/thioredoxin
MKLKNFLTIFVALIALGTGILTHRITTAQPQEKSTQTAGLPDITLPDLEGNRRRLSEWQGKVIVLNFWATWCAPCRKEIPEFIELQKQYGNQGLQFIGIAVEELEPAREYSKHAGINYPILIGQPSAINLSIPLGNMISTVPFTIIFDRQGNIVHRQWGEISKDTILKKSIMFLSN